jgi:predicted MPP superfamily phosphohydrolase
MGFRSTLLFLFLLLNAFVYLALWRAVAYWASPESRRRVLLGVSLVFLLLNLPLAAFFIRPLDLTLLQLPTWVLKTVFYPSTAWLATIIAFVLIAAPLLLVSGLASAVWRWFAARKPAPQATERVPGAPMVSRRDFVAGSAGLLIPAIYGVAAYGTYGTLDDLDVSAEQSIPMPHLPPSFDGMTIVQLTDLHVGPYIREKELRHLVSVVNSLRPDLVVVTGDIVDRHLSSLPEAVRGLAGIESPLGVYAVLGNHDIYADQYSFTRRHRGGVEIARGLETIGIRTLRNEVVHLEEGPDRLALLGLDWLSPNPRSPNFYQYKQKETFQELHQMSSQVEPETPTVLLAHHPDTFKDAQPFRIGLTLAGHTHGGGQVILGNVGGMPIGIGMMRFQYLSGLYRENGYSLYVNRGIGYLGIPIRINCPPEISRFRLIRIAAS